MPMSDQYEARTLAILRPLNDDKETWAEYWMHQGQPWRTEPEIDSERQKYLDERRQITPDLTEGIYPFKNIKLTRADVEWLLATHEHGRGPVDWSDEYMWRRKGLNLPGADLRQTNLNNLPLTRIQVGLSQEERMVATPEQCEMAGVHLEGANIHWAHLERASLFGAYLAEANLSRAPLEETFLVGAHLESKSYRSPFSKMLPHGGSSGRGGTLQSTSGRSFSQQSPSRESQSARGPSGRCSTQAGAFGGG